MIRSIGSYTIQQAKNGEEALELFSKINPQLVIMDLSLPKVKPVPLIRLILKMKPDTRILICSDSGNETGIEEAMDNGAHDFFFKPLQEKDFTEKFKKAVEHISANNTEEKPAEKPDFTKKLNMDMNSHLNLIIFNLYKITNDYTYDDVLSAVIAFQMYGFKNVILHFGKMLYSVFIESEIALLQDTVEQEGGQFFIVAENEQLVKNFLKVNLNDKLMRTLAAAEKSIKK